MKKLLILGLGAIVVVTVTTLYTNHLLDQVKARRATLDREFEELAGRLRELDRAHPPQKETPGRIEACRRVRQAVSDAYGEKLGDHERGGLPAERLRNRVLELFASRLAAAKMGPTEYCALARAPDPQAPHAALIEPVLVEILGERD